MKDHDFNENHRIKMLVTFKTESPFKIFLIIFFTDFFETKIFLLRLLCAQCSPKMCTTTHTPTHEYIDQLYIAHVIS